MFRAFRNLFTRFFPPSNVTPLASILKGVTVPLFPRPPRGPRRPRLPRGGWGPQHRAAHSAPFLLIHSTAPCRVYHHCFERAAAMTWLAGRPGIIEHINGFGQITKRERT